MESEKKRDARDKLVNRACAWLDRRNVKAASTGKARESAQTKLRESEFDLATATEEFLKEK